MAVLIQPLVAARASGGGLSETAEGHMLLSATWGLGSAIAQGEVVPDRIVLSRQGSCAPSSPAARITATPAATARCAPQAVPKELVSEPCLDARRRRSRSAACCASAKTLLGEPVEIEWALDDAGFKLLQARPLHMSSRPQVPDEIWLKHPKLNGHPAGIGWGSGRAVVVNCECELAARRARRRPGDPGGGTGAQPHPAAGRAAWWPSSAARPRISPRSRASAAFRWCSACSMPRTTIPDGAQVAVDGVAGIVRWIA